MAVGLCELVSDVHREEEIDRSLAPFMEELQRALGEPFARCTPAESGAFGLTVVFVKSGGTEARFTEVCHHFKKPVILLATGMHNSLAASLEILTWLRNNGIRGEILHGEPQVIAARIRELEKINAAWSRLLQCRLGVIGAPSDWLIAGSVDYENVRKKLGIELIDIPMEEFLSARVEISGPRHPGHVRELVRDLVDAYGPGMEMEKALQSHAALRHLAEQYRLSGLTIRCFDMLGKPVGTGCIALSLLNSEGITAGCEGDIPALLSMVILTGLTGEPVFMANPSSLSRKEGTVILAHCTVPLSMVEAFSLDTHFESGQGIAICGTMREGKGTLFKLAPDLQNYMAADIDILPHEPEPHFCRTQLKVRMKGCAEYFLKNPMGNHHVICRGSYGDRVRQALERWGCHSISVT